MSQNAEQPPEALPPDFLTRLRQKFYFQGKLKVPVKHVNILMLGVAEDPDFAIVIPQHCQKIEHTEAEHMTRTQWQCGDVRVLDLSHIRRDSPEAAEELKIVTHGWRKFGKPMRASGFLSRNVLGRQFGRDDVPFKHQPHGLLYTPAYSDVPRPSGLPSCPANMEGGAVLKHALKRTLYAEAEARYKAKLRRGAHQDSSDAWKQGYEKGVEECKHSAEWRAMMEKLARCHVDLEEQRAWVRVLQKVSETEE